MQQLKATEKIYIKQWFSRHWTSNNEGQLSLRDRKQSKPTDFSQAPGLKIGREDSGRAWQTPQIGRRAESLRRSKGILNGMKMKQNISKRVDTTKAVLREKFKHRHLYQKRNDHIFHRKKPIKSKEERKKKAKNQKTNRRNRKQKNNRKESMKPEAISLGR